LSRETDEAISIHISSRLSGTYRVASEVAESLLGQYRIMVMDSLTTSLALGNLAIAAAEAAQDGANLDEVVRLVRGMIPHLYLVFFVETFDYLERGGRIGEAQALLGTMLGIKPLLIIEEGEIQPLEKVRTRTDALDKLFEFITEFPHIEKMTLIKGIESRGMEELLQRIETAYPDKEVDVATYGPALATYVGPGAMGVFVYEGMG
jgi:DegV family protein with EDD domain